MKKVLLKDETPTDVIDISQMRPDRIYLAVGNKKVPDEIFILRCEARDSFDWIFRYWKNDCGMCGFSPTMHEAVEKAQKYISSLFEFTSMEEAAEWVSAQKKS